MTLEDAINISQIHAARGFDENEECVVSVAYYGGNLMWLTGFEGNWAKEWKEVPGEDRHKLAGLDFRPTGPKPEEQIERELLDAITEINEEELNDNKDKFEPIEPPD